MNSDNSFEFHFFLAKSVKLKEDLLCHSSAELNCGLAHFVREVRRPNGESYAPDSVYYLCLGIQEVSNFMVTWKYKAVEKGCCAAS